MARGTSGGGRAAQARELADAASRLGAVLYDLDADAGVAALNDATTWRGHTAQLIGDTTEVLATLWGRWAALRDVADRADLAAGAGDEAQLATLLDTPVELPDGTAVDPAQLATDLASEAERVARVAAELDTALVRAAELVGDARTTLAELEERAGSLGVADAGAMLDARAAVHRLTEDAQLDPAAPDLGSGATDALEAAHELVTAADERARSLPDRLSAAATDVDELRELIDQGARALELARAKVVVAGGLLEPLDPSIVDAEPMGLAPWLARIRAAADRRDVRAATAGLTRWEAVASVHLANARAVAEANTAPLRSRDELRGLLGALRAKAAAIGLAEDRDANRLHDTARELLYVAPCPLAQAERAVEAYRLHVTEGEAAT